MLLTVLVGATITGLLASYRVTKSITITIPVEGDEEVYYLTFPFDRPRSIWHAYKFAELYTKKGHGFGLHGSTPNICNKELASITTV